MRVVCTGSRGWAHPRVIHDRLDRLPRSAQIVVGGYRDKDGNVLPTRGADTIVFLAALRHGMRRPIVIPAEWAEHGRKAGPIRNEAMLDERKPALVLAFWKGHSPGTKHTIDAAMRRGLPVEIHWRP